MFRKLILACAAILLAESAWPQPAKAQTPPVCTGKDILAEMKVKDPPAYQKLVAEASKIPNGDAVFWRIDGPSGTPPSWLLGTIHLSDPRVVALNPAISQALEKASVVGIATIDLVSKTAAENSVWRIIRYLVLPLGGNLFDLLSEGDAELLRRRLAASGLDPDSYSPYQPWYVSDFILYPACEYARATAGLNFLDETIAKRAIAEGIDVVTLDDIEAQAVLFATIPLSDQLAFLAAAVRFKYSMEDDTETAVQTWLNGQVALYYVFANGFAELTADEVAAAKRAESFLLDRRAEAMRDKALPFLKQGNAFIAIGGYYLFGENGLVELLRNAGYKVTPVK